MNRTKPIDHKTDSHSEVIVAVGTDHHPFDRLMGWVDEWAMANPDVSVLVQRGTSTETLACDSVELLPHPELCERFARASVVVSHGGPSTVMDARMGGSRPIVVARNPEFGEHVDEHQMRFAEHLRRHNLAEVIDEKSQFLEAMDLAVQRPEYFEVPVEASDITGVVEFGRVLDDLLGVVTPLLPTTPSELASPLPAAEDVPEAIPSGDAERVNPWPAAEDLPADDLQPTSAEYADMPASNDFEDSSR